MKEIDVEAATIPELVMAASDYVDALELVMAASDYDELWDILLELRIRCGEDNSVMDSSLLSEKEGRLTQREAVRGKILVRRDGVRENLRDRERAVTGRERAVDFECVGRDAEAGD